MCHKAICNVSAGGFMILCVCRLLWFTVCYLLFGNSDIHVHAIE